MSAKDVVKRLYEEAISAGDLSLIAALVSIDYLDHNVGPERRGPEVLRDNLTALHRTFPDFTLRIEDIVAEGDKVVTRVTGQGTHRGAWMASSPPAPSSW